MLFHAPQRFGQVLVALGGLADFIRGLGFAEPIRDIARVAQRAGEVALQNVGVQVGGLAAAHGINEVGEVAGDARERLNLNAVLVQNLRTGVTGDHHGAALTIHDQADAHPAILIHVFVLGPRRQSAHFKDERRRRVIVEDNHGVGRGAVIDVAKPATDTQDARRQRRLAQGPAPHVHLVNALIAEVAVAGGPDPMPIIVQLLAHQRLFRRRAIPQVVVNARRNRLRAIHFADAGAALVAQAARAQDFPDVAFPHPLNAFSHAAARARLRAGLHDAVKLAGHLDDPATFPNVVGDRLLDIHILAGLHRPDGSERVPMVRRRKADDVNILVLQQLADVAIGFNLLAQVLVFLHLAVKDGLVHVAKRNHPGAFDRAQAIDVAHAAPIESDHREPDIAVGASRVRSSRRAGFALLAFLGAQRGEQA